MPSGNLIAPAEWHGTKGLVSNSMAHDADPQTFAAYTDIVNEVKGRRRKRPGIGAPVDPAAAAAEISAMHHYLRTDPASGAQTWTIFEGVGTTLRKWNGAAWVTCAIGGLGAFTGSAWRFCNFRNRCFIVNGADGLFYFDGSLGPDGREIYRAGIATPTAAIGYSLTVVDPPYVTGTITVTKGNRLIVGDGATVWSLLWDGKFIDIAGVRYQIDTVVVGTPGQAMLVDAYRGENAPGVAYKIYVGLMDWDEPPQYTYGYLNTRTGHTSNTGPILQIEEKDLVGHTPRLTAIPYSPADFNNGYDKIQIYRTAKNGAIMVAINPAFGGQINNSNIAGTTTYTETVNSYRDTALTQSPAPDISNERPLNNAGTADAAFTAIAVWNGRLWALSPRDAKMFYSANNAEIEFGRHEECWPSINFLPVDDGRGLVAVGGTSNGFLLVQTGTEERYVVGADVRTFNCVELPGGRSVGGHALHALSVQGSLVQFYADKRLIDYGAAENIPEGDIGRPIQDKLNAIPDAYIEKVRLTWFSFADRNLLLLSAPKGPGSTFNDVTYVFDRDCTCWYEWSVGFSAMAVVTNLTTARRELWAAQGSNKKVYKLLQSGVFDDDGANFTPVMRSQWLRPFGYGKAALWRWSRAWISDPTKTWKGIMRVSEDPVGTTYTMRVAEFKRQSANGNEMICESNTKQRKRGEVAQFELVWPTTATDLFVDKMRAEFGLDQDVEETE